MKTHANQVQKQRVQISGGTMAMARAAAIAVLLAWTPSSIGSANHDSVPTARLPAVPPQAAGTKADPGYRPGHFPGGPMCAELVVIMPTRFTEASGVSADAVGCGLGNNLAAGTPARVDEGDRVDVATFLAWHVEGRNLGQDIYQATLSAPARTNAQDRRASAVTVRAPFWTTIAR